MALAKGKFLGNHFDKLILSVCLIGLVLSVVFVALRLLQRPEDPKSSVRVAPKEVNLVDIEQFEIESLLTNRVMLTNQVLISELRLACTNSFCLKLIKERAKVCPFCGFPQPDPDKRDSDNDGIPDRYELAHGMDPLNARDFYEDRDKDGYTNGEEFASGTNPDDPLSHGSFIEKVCIARTENKPLKFRFQGAQSVDESGTNLVFQLNLRTLDRTFFARMNEVVEGYKVINYTPLKVTNQNSMVRDVSVIKLDDGEEVLEMQLGKVVDKNRVAALLLFLLDPEPRIVVKRDSEFNLKEQKFRVINLEKRSALVRNTDSGEEHLINVCTDDEKREFLRRKEGLLPAAGFDDAMEFSPGPPPPMPFVSPKRMR